MALVRRREALDVSSLAPRKVINRCTALLILWVVLPVLFGCAQRHYLRPRSEPVRPLARVVRVLGGKELQPSSRVMETLRRYGLLDSRRPDAQSILPALQEEYQREPTLEKCYALAELAYLGGIAAQRRHQVEQALDYYAAAVAYAYLYLFDPQFDLARNPYDPLFRQASDVYNLALEGAIRLYCPDGRLAIGNQNPIRIGARTIQMEFALRTAWPETEIDHIEFVSDYELEGLSTRHHTYGLGVPLIVVRRSPTVTDPADRYYPPGLSYAATAFLRVQAFDGNVPTHCVLEVHDPLFSRFTRVGHQIVPLETDLSTPLAYFLDTPEFNERLNLATLGLLNPQRTQTLTGIFMVEPYQPDKIPVLLIHGLWSSPATWMEMFNDLRSFPEIREHYQFWFYQYPTGQPFWISAAQLREDLQQLRATLDPEHQSRALDYMVLVGHSMGGLVARMQTIDSQDRFWHLVSSRPIDELNADEQDREALEKLLFFQPNPSIRRVVTIGTPHRGSNAAHPYVRWLARRVIRLPQLLISRNEQLIFRNPGFFHNTDLLTITTSIDSLAPNSPVLSAILQAPKAPWVRYHNIVGLVPQEGLLASLTSESDGVVNFASAHLPDAESEITVSAHHLLVHQHPRTILEVRRILRENLWDYQQEQNGPTRLAGQQALSLPVAPGSLAPGSAGTPGPGGLHQPWFDTSDVERSLWPPAVAPPPAATPAPQPNRPHLEPALVH
ncbi:MAG: hypothetical protein KatS3mg109_1399 [Pirellulaceae bacterium]|nr:MAG: hypothetical protein KatS3mg109_1399 [Pirellulaceae bacterium]